MIRLLVKLVRHPNDFLKIYRLILKPTLETKLHNLSNQNNCLIKIHPTNSPTTIRDMLIFLNKIYIQNSTSGNKIDNMIVYLNEDVQFYNFGEIYSSFYLNSKIVDTHFYWFDNVQNEILPFCEISDRNGENLSHSLQAFVNNLYVPIQSIDYFNTCDNNFLDVPPINKVWARNVLKGYKPGSFIISIHFPEFNNEDNANMLRNWRSFFIKAWKDFPHFHFLLLNFSIEWDKESTIDLPNVTITKMLGYNFLEEFALVQLSDMFIGSYDKYAIAVIGTNKPFMLFGLSDVDASQISCETNCNTRQLSRSKHQIWILDIPSSTDFYVMFKHFYTDVADYKKPVAIDGLNQRKMNYSVDSNLTTGG